MQGLKCRIGIGIGLSLGIRIGNIEHIISTILNQYYMAYDIFKSDTVCHMYWYLPIFKTLH